MTWCGQYDAVPVMINALQNESPAWRKSAAASLGSVFEDAWPSRLSPLIEGSNPTLSLRPQSEPQLGDLVEAQAQGIAPWPMGRVYALSDPFFVAMKQGVFDVIAQPGQGAR
jgi:hypothetical protein